MIANLINKDKENETENIEIQDNYQEFSETINLETSETDNNNEKELRIDTGNTAKLDKKDMILHGNDGKTKRIVNLYIDDSGLNMIIGDETYSLTNVRSVSLSDAKRYINNKETDLTNNELKDLFTIHIEHENEIKHIVLEANDEKERDLWAHHIVLMAMVCAIN